jgi:hypothetical protein
VAVEGIDSYPGLDKEEYSLLVSNDVAIYLFD